MNRVRTIIVSLLVTLGIAFSIAPAPARAQGPAFDNALYGAFYDGMRSSGHDVPTANCLAAFLTSTTKWHGPDGYVPPADRHDGDSMWQVIWEIHPFVQSTLSFQCPTMQPADRFGTSAQGHARVDVARICTSNSPDVECDPTERHRLTFVAAREVGHTYCFQQTGSDTCGYAASTAECVVDYYARHLMQVPWPGDTYSYYTMCVTYGGMPA